MNSTPKQAVQPKTEGQKPLGHLTDILITQLCAQAMGYEVASQQIQEAMKWTDRTGVIVQDGIGIFDPLADDAQALALVKKFELHVKPIQDVWHISGWYEGRTGALFESANSADLNRAICECVAKMQQAKS